MTPDIAMAHFVARAATVEQTIRDAKNAELIEPAQEALAFLVNTVMQMMHVMSHIEREAMDRGIAAAEHCTATQQGGTNQTIH